MLRLRSSARFASVALLLAMGSCDGEEDDSADDGMTAGACEGEDRTDDFGVDLTKMGEIHTVRLVEAEPADPIRGDNSWVLMVTDANGAGMDGMTIDALPWMPDHGHGTAVEETITELGGGEYAVEPLNLFMAGLWQVTFELTDADGATDEVMISVCVE